MATCYRHPSRETGVSCANCGRPICPDCMTPTPVGMRCPECARQRTKTRSMANLSGNEPRLTYILIGLCVVAFLGSGSFGVGGTGNDLFARGALSQYTVASGEYYRLITSGFLHSGFLHIAFNMYLLYLLGTQLEQRLGTLRFGVLYFTSMLAGALGALLQTTAPLQGTVGASGAIFGLMGAMAVELRRQGYDPLRSDIGVLIGLNLVLGFVIPNVSWGGHLGGLAGGILCMLALNAAAERRVAWAGYAACGALAAVAVAAAIAVANSGAQGLPGIG
jgi:membrane associated rhomboid family serine protease